MRPALAGSCLLRQSAQSGCRLIRAAVASAARASAVITTVSMRTTGIAAISVRPARLQCMHAERGRCRHAQRDVNDRFAGLRAMADSFAAAVLVRWTSLYAGAARGPRVCDGPRELRRRLQIDEAGGVSPIGAATKCRWCRRMPTAIHSRRVHDPRVSAASQNHDAYRCPRQGPGAPRRKRRVPRWMRPHRRDE